MVFKIRSIALIIEFKFKKSEVVVNILFLGEKLEDVTDGFQSVKYLDDTVQGNN